MNYTCIGCHKDFIGSAAYPKSYCPECDGTNALLRKEAERWAGLTPDQKCDELKKRLDEMHQRSQWDGRIG